MIRHLADFAKPLHAVVHREPFTWTKEEEKAFAALKLLLTRAPVVQLPFWNREFHVFVDASDIAIGSVLMQKYEKNWFRPVYYTRRRLSKAETSHFDFVITYRPGMQQGKADALSRRSYMELRP
jgi:hypothetical protein